MLDEKHEQYWDSLDIDEKWRKILKLEHEEYKKSVDTYYRHTRQLNDKLINKTADEKFDSNGNDCSDIKESVNKIKLRAALRKLTNKQRTVFELYMFTNHTQKEIAEVMGNSQGNISELISRAVIKIQKELNK
jgi:RNA polymerase sigma factor (sigma-70 family)